MGQINSSPSNPLGKDLRRLINDERFYDIILKCSDGRNVFGCKAILATRSEMFNELIFTGSANKNLSFDNVNSNAMKVILEYLYTDMVKEENLTVANVIEAYYASVHFNLMELQLYIIERTAKFLKDGNEDVGKKLLSECVDKLPSVNDENDNDFISISQILVRWVAKDKLKKDEVDSLSSEGLRYLLEKTYDTQTFFATPEFNIWEYALMKARRNSNLARRGPQGIQEYLTPLIRYINLNRMDPEEIKQHVEPLNIFPIQKIKNIYRTQAMGENLGFIRGAPIFRWKNDERSFFGLIGLIFSKDGFTVEAADNLKQPKSIFGDLIFKGKGVYEWSILIEKLNKKVYIGICGINESSYIINPKCNGWVLGSDGYVYHNNKWKWYDAKFKQGDKVTVHLNMKMKTCAFSINENRKPIVSGWDRNHQIPSQVYPIVSLERGPTKLRIHQDFYN